MHQLKRELLLHQDRPPLGFAKCSLHLHDAAMIESKPPRIDRFKGLNNVSDSLRLSLGWLSVADNINITETGAIEKRPGYSRVRAGAFTGSYSTFDFSRMYVVDGGSLQAISSISMVPVTLKTGLSTKEMFWTELNDQVFFNNGVDCGIILQDNTVIDWYWSEPVAPNIIAVTGKLAAGSYQARITYTLPDGRETGASESAEITLGEGQAIQLSNIQQIAGYRANVYIAPANSAVYQFAGSTSSSSFGWNASPDNLGADLLTNMYDPIPLGSDVIQEWKGRIYAAQYVAPENQSVIWFSQPMATHLFNLNSDYFMVPGHVLMFASTKAGLIIGTDTRIYAYDGQRLEQIADYGVVPGQHCAKDGEQIIFWTTRGVCKALPFTNLTERQVSVAPGVQAGGTIVSSGGQKRYVVALHQGGAAFNKHF